jgi:hypothetical protein
VNAPIRQGDVYLVPVDQVPGGMAPLPRDAGRLVVQHGEATGHAHAIAAPDAELLAAPGATASAVDRYLRLRSAGVLVHEEHGSIELAPGTYRVVIGEEWTDDMEPRQVVD